MFLRFLKTILNVERRNESLREMLWSHKGFSLESAFEHLDRNKSNTISADEFDKAFADADLPIAGRISDKLVEIMDDDEDNTVDMREFAQAVTPMDA